MARAPSRAAAASGDALVRVDEVRGRALRVAGGVAEQQVGQRLQAGLAGDLRLGTPFRLVGQVEVFQPGLGVGGADLGLELVGQLALGGDLLQDRVPALVEFAQVAQALLERAQLRVVERAGGLLAVPGDERHGGAAVEQFDRGADLPDGHAQLVGDPLVHGRGFCVTRALCQRANTAITLDGRGVRARRCDHGMYGRSMTQRESPERESRREH